MPADADLQGFLVQQMVEGGVETIVGVVQAPTFGPLVGFGLGGTTVEVLNDVALRITLLTDKDAREMARSIRGLPLLQGYRGNPPPTSTRWRACCCASPGWWRRCRRCRRWT